MEEMGIAVSSSTPGKNLRRWRAPDHSWFAKTSAWPLLVFFVGFPLWWLAGFGTIGFLLMGALLGYQLLQGRSIRAPAGFGLWLLFLGVLAVGVVVLWVPVPGLADETGLGRLLTWGYRLGWFISATAVMLYIGNSSERAISSRLLVRLMAWMFAVTVAGGYAGQFLSSVDFPSLLEVALPARAASNAFVQTLIHPGLAQVQDILGFDSPRPKAPFDYANSWGANFGLLLPYFILATSHTRTRTMRVVMIVVLVAAVPPSIMSLNRGLWLGLAAMALVFGIRLALKGKYLAIISTFAAGLLGLTLLVTTPLWDTVQSRLDNPHSNTGRSNLAGYTLEIVSKYSPVIGLGSTRERQGNFFSAAAGATADCHQCSPPQLGTQGTLWYLVFCTGFLGAALFLAFFIRRYAPVFRASDPNHAALMYPAIFFACVLPVYDLVSPSFMILMIGTGLAWRYSLQEQSQREVGTP